MNYYEGGAFEGYGKRGTGWYPNEDGTVIDEYRFRSQKETFQLPQTQTPQDYLFLQIPYGEWPYRLLPISDMGCVQEACVDEHERMFLVVPVENDELYGLFRLPWTLEEWLWRWIRDETTLV